MMGLDRVLIRKYIGQSMPLLLACGLVLFAFAWIRVWVVSLLDMGKFKAIVEQLREFERFSPIEFDAMFTYPGRVGGTFDEPVVVLCVVIWCVARGSDVVSGELGRGTLEMILAQPIRRITLLWSHAVVSIAGLILLCSLVWAGIAIGVQVVSVSETIEQPTFQIPILRINVPLTLAEPTQQIVPLRERVDARYFSAPTFHLVAFGFFLLGLASLCSACDRYRWRTVGAVVGFYVIQVVILGLGKATDKLAWLEPLSFLSLYRPQRVASLIPEHGLSAPWRIDVPFGDELFPPLVYPLILLGLGTLFYVVAAIVFSRRDLPAPL
jgi:ABC-2 type transport system permease protein